MSVALMTLAFRAAIPATPKLVLLALCDSANDEGECYPSISTLETKCSLSDRAVQKAIHYLGAGNYLTRQERPGRATVYQITPERGVPPNDVHPEPRSPTPERRSPPPPNDVHPTPEPRSPLTIREPSVEPLLKRIAGSPVASPAPDPGPLHGDSNLADIPARAMVCLSAGFDLPESWGVDAERLGWKAGEILKESERFRQYWTVGKGQGKRRSVKGWRQSWSNWLANKERFTR